MLEALKADVFRANQRLVSSGLVVLTWGNASGFDPESKLMVIKPSGVDYDKMTADDMVVVDLGGNVVEGKLRPSSDTATHLEFYRSFRGVRGPVPVTRVLTEDEVNSAYELNTGKVIVERFRDLEPLAVPGVLVAGHAPFTWGTGPQDAVDHAIALEAIAKMARLTEEVCAARPAPGLVPYVGEKHYQRKHGKNAYYGQN